MMYTYLCNHRPPQIGAMPTNGLIRCENHGIGRYGEVIYNRPLSSEEAEIYELLPYCSDQFVYATAEKVADQIIGGQRAMVDTENEYPFIEFYIGFDEKGNLGLTASQTSMQIHYPVDIYNHWIEKNYNKFSNEELFLEKLEQLEYKFENKDNCKFMRICSEIANEINSRLEEYWS